MLGALAFTGVQVNTSRGGSRLVFRYQGLVRKLLLVTVKNCHRFLEIFC